MIIEMLARRAGVQLSPPTAFVATPVSAGRIDLSWTNANAAYQTEIWRNDTLYQTIAAGTNTYVDTGVAGGTAYSYRLRHKSGSSFSPFGSTVVQSGTPAAPSLNSTSVNEDDVTLTWGAVPSAVSYRVRRDGVEIAPGITATTYDDLTLPNATYAYTVRAFNGVNESADSNTENAVVSFAEPLADPTGFSATPSHSDRITLAWTNGDATADIEVYRSPTGSGSWTLLDTLAPTTTSYADEGLSQTTTYYYRIRHVKGAQVSDYVTDDATTPTTTLSGISLTASVSTDEVVLSWTVNNPPQTPTISIGDWTDTVAVGDTAGTSGITSPHTILNYLSGPGRDIISSGGTSVTGTLAFLRVAAGATTLDQVNNITVDFRLSDEA